jgi:methionine synthase II (cobalamin-independent)
MICPASEKDQMKTSKERILTTHTGSLPRPKPLIDLVMNRERGAMIDAAAFAAETAKAVDDIVTQSSPRASTSSVMAR